MSDSEIANPVAYSSDCFNDFLLRNLCHNLERDLFSLLSVKR